MESGSSFVSGVKRLGRPLGHFIFSLIGLKRMLFTNIFQRLSGANLGEILNPFAILNPKLCITQSLKAELHMS